MTEKSYRVWQSGELHLWWNVIERALWDAEGIGSWTSGLDIERHRARRFLEGEGRSLELIFDMIGVDPGCYFTRLLPVLRQRWIEVDAELAAGRLLPHRGLPPS